MSAWPHDRLARAERLADYFDLQLRFARRFSERAGIAFTDGVERVTNIRRRLGLAPELGVEADNHWRALLMRIGEASDPIAVICEAFVALPGEPVQPGHTRFGCFKCEPPGEDGVVRAHFSNAELGGAVSPLHDTRIAARRAELRTLYAFVRDRYPLAKSVSGGSWLYNLEAYRRLFPPEFTASRHVPEGPVRLNGSSSWGQFLDHEERLKPAPARALMANLEVIDIAAPWTAFPLRALRATASIHCFYEFYA